MDEEGVSDKGREEGGEEEEDDEENDGDGDNDDDDDDNEDDANENQPEVDRRVAAMLQDQREYMQMSTTSAQILQMLSHFMPAVVPEKTQVVELESISDDSDDSVSTPRSGTSDTPGSGSGDTSECVIYAEPIMSCQIVPMWNPPCDDVRRLPPGVRPDDVKRMNSARGRGRGRGGGGPGGTPGRGRGRGSSGHPFYRPGQWSSCLGGSAPGRGPAHLGSGDTNISPKSTGNTCGLRSQSSSTQGKATDDQSNKSTTQATTSLTTATTSSPSTTTTSTTTTTETAMTSSGGGQGEPSKDPGLHDIGVSNFGVTHNDFNDAMLKISSAADTIRQARLLLASFNSAVQGRNNNNPQESCGEEDTGQGGDSVKNGSPNRTSTHGEVAAAASGDQGSNMVERVKDIQLSPKKESDHKQAEHSSGEAPESKKNFREPILVKPVPRTNRKSPSRFRRDEDSSTLTVAGSSPTSTVAELNSIPTDSGIARGQKHQSLGTQQSASTFTRPSTLSLHSRLGSAFFRRSVNQCRTPWSLRMTPSEYLAARVARCPRLYGPLTRPSGMANRNQQSTLLGSSQQEHRAVPPLGNDIVPSTGSGSRPVSSSADHQLHSAGTAAISTDAVRQQTASQAKVKQKITLEDLRRALDLAFKKLEKSDGWTGDKKSLTLELAQAGGSDSQEKTFSLTPVNQLTSPGRSNNDGGWKSIRIGADDRGQDAQTVKDIGSGDGSEVIKIATKVERISIVQQDLTDELLAGQTTEDRGLKEEKEDSGKRKDQDDEDGDQAPVCASGTHSRKDQPISAATDPADDSASICVTRISSKASQASSRSKSVTKVTRREIETQTDLRHRRMVGKGHDKGDNTLHKDEEEDDEKVKGDQENPKSCSIAHSMTPSMSSYKDTLASIESYHEEIQLSPSELALYQRNFCEHPSSTKGERILWPSKRGWVSGSLSAKRKGRCGDDRHRDADTSTYDSTASPCEGQGRQDSGRRTFSCLHGRSPGPCAESSQISKVSDNDISEESSAETVTMKSESVGSSISSTLRKFVFIRRRPPRPISYQELCKQLDEEQELEASRQTEDEKATNNEVITENKIVQLCKPVDDENFVSPIEEEVMSFRQTVDTSIPSPHLADVEQAKFPEMAEDEKNASPTLSGKEKVVAPEQIQGKQGEQIEPARYETVAPQELLETKLVMYNPAAGDKTAPSKPAKVGKVVHSKVAEMGDVSVYKVSEREKIPRDKAGGDMRDEPDCVNSNNDPDEDDRGVFVTKSGTRLKSILMGGKSKSIKTPCPSMETLPLVSTTDPQDDQVQSDRKSLPEVTLSNTPSKTDLRTRRSRDVNVVPYLGELEKAMPSPTLSSRSSSVIDVGAKGRGDAAESKSPTRTYLDPNDQQGKNQKGGFRSRLRDCFARCFRIHWS